MNLGAWGTLEGKYYQWGYSVSVSSSVNWFLIWWLYGMPLWLVHTNYSELILKQIKDWDDEEIKNENMLTMPEDIIGLQELGEEHT